MRIIVHCTYILKYSTYGSCDELSVDVEIYKLVNNLINDYKSYT